MQGNFTRCQQHERHRLLRRWGFGDNVREPIERGDRHPGREACEHRHGIEAEREGYHIQQHDHDKDRMVQLGLVLEYELIEPVGRNGFTNPFTIVS